MNILQLKLIHKIFIIVVCAVVVLCVLSCKPVFGVAEVKPVADTGYSNQEDAFTEVAGKGQSISAERNQNDQELIVAGLFGLITIIIIGAVSHSRSRRNLKQKDTI